MHKYILAIGVILFMTGCEDRYRYPCQDPKNHNSPECRIEICDETRECPKPLKGHDNGE